MMSLSLKKIYQRHSIRLSKISVMQKNANFNQKELALKFCLVDILAVDLGTKRIVCPV